MKTKHYIALFAFVAAFAVSAVIANFLKIEQGALVLWDDARSAQKINRLLTEDVANGQLRAYDRDSTEAVANYIGRAENLDDANLPRDFQRAWRMHLRAWRNQSNFMTYGVNYNSSRQAQYISTRNSYEINRTWYRVLESAKANGAEIPAGAYE